ncbi:hypothetical protein ACHAXA_001165 [Cyclostephanos tholiformis]|uniref:Integral membrane protein n=1 Tax=Cyclostephanos tholiformis TaxID=382380 RepID=A0ABD3R961_9STRA
MIVSGAARSIAVKLAYQSGLKAPLTITLLYLFGQSMSLFVYYWNRTKMRMRRRGLVHCLHLPRAPSSSSSSSSSSSRTTDYVAAPTSEEIELTTIDPPPPSTTSPSASTPPIAISSDSANSASPSPSSSVVAYFHSSFYNDDDENDGEGMPRGSRHGLSDESEERTRRSARDVPWQARPALPALFNLLSSGLRWAALLYVDASVAEIIMSGLELCLAASAARCIRGRNVAYTRWGGISIVAFGVVIVERANRGRHVRSDDDGNDDNDARRPHSGSFASDATIGVVLIIIQTIFSVLQDIGEEIFMQVADFPATKMLGMEGFYGLVLGLIVYVAFGDKLSWIEDVNITLSTMREDSSVRIWMIGLPILFLITGIFNSKATEATSAMTRNVWKNVRTLLIWIVALGIFYIGRNPDYGEAWHTPESAHILFGFGIMTAGIVVYYRYKEQERYEPALDEDTIALDNGTESLSSSFE